MLLTIIVSTPNLRGVASIVANELKQQSAFATTEQEILLGLRIAAARVVEPWASANGVTVADSDVEDTVTRLDQDLAPDGLDKTAARYDVTRDDVRALHRDAAARRADQAGDDAHQGGLARREARDGADVWVTSPDEFRDFIAKEIPRWAEVVKAAKIKLD